jgi:acid phosphatase (class A)
MPNKKTLLLITTTFLFGVATFFLYAHIQHKEQLRAYQDSLTFSNTQVWDAYFLENAHNAVDTERYILPPATTNSSETTKRDLEILHKYQNERTKENIAEIEREIVLDGAYFGEETFVDIVSKTDRPDTLALMRFVLDFEFPLILEQKLKYDRVRPSYLDPTIIPVIDVPQHPAYPSGHSAQAHLRALILSELDPQNKETYEKAAERIARNREIAGVHYPSDSAAGVIMARQIFEVLLKNVDFLTLLEQAKAEW